MYIFFRRGVSIKRVFSSPSYKKSVFFFGTKLMNISAFVPRPEHRYGVHTDGAGSARLGPALHTRQIRGLVPSHLTGSFDLSVRVMTIKCITLHGECDI